MVDIWIIPVHIRPVVSHDILTKGKVERPKNGMDRLTLTEVGEMLLDLSLEKGFKTRIRRAQPPFPWEMAVFDNGLEVATLTGYFIGPSTFRSIFRLRSLKNSTGEKITRKILEDLKRDPLGSKYWNDDTWQRFSSKTGLSRDEVMDQNEKMILRS